MHDPLLDIAMRLEEVALTDDYFIERKLYPNVDFYTGLIYKAMGFPTQMFTVLFALGRLPGWIAQWREMNEDPETKIGRPRQIYTGEPSATTSPSPPASPPLTPRFSRNPGPIGDPAPRTGVPHRSVPVVAGCRSRRALGRGRRGPDPLAMVLGEFHIRAQSHRTTGLFRRRRSSRCFSAMRSAPVRYLSIPSASPMTPSSSQYMSTMPMRPSSS